MHFVCVFACLCSWILTAHRGHIVPVCLRPNLEVGRKVSHLLPFFLLWILRWRRLKLRGTLLRLFFLWALKEKAPNHCHLILSHCMSYLVCVINRRKITRIHKRVIVCEWVVGSGNVRKTVMSGNQERAREQLYQISSLDIDSFFPFMCVRLRKGVWL